MGKIIVTGGQGFVGRNLTELLVKNGETVCSTYCYTPPVIPINQSLQSFFKLDVTKFEDCLKLINQENPEIVYHLVAQPLVTAAGRHPFPTMELTIRGTYNILEAIRQSNKNTKVILFTSDKVYGENSNAKETDRIDTVSHPYEVAKSCEDLIGRSYSDFFEIPIVTIRSANVYGRYDLHWDRLIPYLCREIVHGRAPVFRSDGKQVRDYVYIDDVLNALVMAQVWAGGLTANLGAEQSHTALQIMDKLLEISGRIDLSPKFKITAKGEISNQHINYDLAQALGWNPITSIDLGLKKTYEWYKEWFA